jgi:hypothetical protein
MANLSRIRSKAELIGTLNPKAWDAVKPKVPFVFSNAHVELLVADVVRSVAAEIADKAIAQDVLALSQAMAKSAFAAMVAAWEPGDEVCPPWPWPSPWPGPWPWVDRGSSDPAAWKPVAPAEQIEVAHILTQLAGLTTSREFNAALKAAAARLAERNAPALAAAFKRCPTAPRRPFRR